MDGSTSAKDGRFLEVESGDVFMWSMSGSSDLMSSLSLGARCFRGAIESVK